MHKKRLFRLLGLSMLVAISAMAVSASAAQAKWLILVNKVSVKSIELNATVPPGNLLVPGLGLNITCDDEGVGGSAAVKGSLNEAETVLTGTAVATFKGCVDVNFGEVCDVRSTGQAAGTIVANGTGTAGMTSANDYHVDASSANFTKIEYIGEECPLTEIDGTVSGKVRIHILNALEDTKLKVAVILDEGIFFGEEEASLHDGEEGDINASATEASGNTWALHLVGL